MSSLEVKMFNILDMMTRMEAELVSKGMTMEVRDQRLDDLEYGRQRPEDHRRRRLHLYIPTLNMRLEAWDTDSLRTDNIWGLYYVTLYSEFAQFDYIPPI